ncbi:hypothetical protein JYK00_00750 [Thermosipho ferrireducens]|uniref:Uncharacterized protein n=1 Tax=Thermosipho ferrireducens TaxID=2571116 RepID=A0ABX7S8E6_9BACT|nr:hypothetical protein [Thermosipho ferrireducens]QTA38106.1 hypothetical protein JYK00_00750 [Thermosipho ferrireducens]
MKRILFSFFVLVFTIGYSLNIPRYIGPEDVEFDFEGLVAFFDGTIITDNTISGLDYLDGAHTLRLVGEYQEFIFRVIVDTKPPTITEFVIRDPDSVFFKRPAMLLSIDSRENPIIGEISGNFTRGDRFPTVVFSKDDAGNLGGFSYIRPSVSKVTPLESKTPIGGINGKYILLTSKSPYKIIGKVIIPEDSVLFIEPGVEIKAISGASFITKGNLNIPEGVVFSGNIDIDVQAKGTLYISKKEFSGKITSNVGRLIFLENTNVGEVKLNKTNVVIVKDSVIDDLEIKYSSFVVIQDSTVTNLSIRSTRNVLIQASYLKRITVETFSNVLGYDLLIGQANMYDFSKVSFIRSNIDFLHLSKACNLSTKSATINNLTLSDYSTAKLYDSNVGTLKMVHSEIRKRFSKIVNLQKDKNSNIEDY